MQAEILEVADLSAQNIDVIGDRYLVEIIEFNKFINLGGPIAIKVEGETEETSGWRAGRVVRIGNGHRLERDETHPMFANVGDMVMMERYSGRLMAIGGKPHVLVNQTALLGIVRL